MNFQQAKTHEVAMPNRQSESNNLRKALRCSASALVIAAFVYGQALPAHADSDEHKPAWISIEAQAFWLEGDRQIWTEDIPGTPFTIRPNNGLTGRFGIGMPIGHGLGIAAYARLGRTDSRDANANVNVITNGLYNVLGGNYLTPYTSGRVIQKEKHTVLDFEARKDVGLGMDIEATVKAGVRYANFQASTDTAFSLVGFNGTQFTLTEDRDAKFWGIGPRIGLDIRVPINDDWTFDVSGSGSYLWGKSQRRIITTATVAGISNGINANESDSVWNLEGSAGVSYILDNAEFTAGVRAEHWWGVFDQTRTFAFNGNFGDKNANRLHWGPFVRLTYKLGGDGD